MTIGYANMPPIIGMLVSSRIATLAELQSVYSVEDAYNLVEIVSVDNVNQRAAQNVANGN